MEPMPAHRSGIVSAAEPLAASPRRHVGIVGYARPLAGLGMGAAIVLIVAMAVGFFRGDFTETVPLTVMADRAGLVMNPDAKVKMRDILVGRVSSIDVQSVGLAAIHLATNPPKLA